MNDETKIPPEGSGSTTDSNWQEVGRQFQELGQSLAQAMRTAWENEETQRRVQAMRMGLQSMAQEIGKAVEDTAHSPEGQKVRQDAERAAETLRGAAEQTVQEVRPQLINALEQLNVELQKLVSRMEQKSEHTASSAATSTPPEPGQGPSEQV
jgi:uncharacterized membrane protein YccC